MSIRTCACHLVIRLLSHTLVAGDGERCLGTQEVTGKQIKSHEIPDIYKYNLEVLQGMWAAESSETVTV